MFVILSMVNLKFMKKKEINIDNERNAGKLALVF